jgi:glycerol-3-phosphate dehydrogenase
VTGDPAKVAITAEEIDYLCAAASEYFTRAVTRADIVWTFAGVRPLYDDGASDAKSATRDYVFELDADASGAPLLSIFGGKITTYRRLAEAALDKLAPHLPTAARGPWTHDGSLPGGDFAVDGIAELVGRLRALLPALDATHAERLARTYGTRAIDLVGTTGDLGRQFGATLTEREVRHLVRHEWARTAEDIVWRRTKLGLAMSKAEVEALDHWLRETRLSAASA